MYHFFVEPGQIHVPEKKVVITGQDVNHIKNVLRMKPGEELSVSTGTDSNEYPAALFLWRRTAFYVNCGLSRKRIRSFLRRYICSRDFPRQTRWS